MPPAADQPNMWISYAITAVVVSVIFYFRARRMRRERPLKLETIWVLPALYALLAAALYWSHPPHGLTWAICALALVAGAGLGWQRGRMMRITVDPETHALNQSASPAALFFLIGIVVLRMAIRETAAFGGAFGRIDPFAVTDVLIAFVLGLLTLQRVEMYLRAKRLLDEARGAKA